MPIDWSSVIQHAVTLTHNYKAQKAQENKTYKQKKTSVLSLTMKNWPVLCVWRAACRVAKVMLYGGAFAQVSLVKHNDARQFQRKGELSQQFSK